MDMPYYNLKITSEFEVAKQDILEYLYAGNIRQATQILEALEASSYVMVLEKRISDELLSNDAYEAYSQLFEQDALIRWVSLNTEYAVNHCPNIIDVFGSLNPIMASNMVTQHIKDPEEFQAAFYTPENVFHVKVPSFLRGLMAHKDDAEAFWKTANPFWIGAPNSSERAWATEHYFDMQFWPLMVCNYMFDSSSSLEQPIYNASTWLSWGPMPYTVALIQHLQTPDYQFLPAKAICIPINADPWDACVAKTIVKYLPIDNVKMSFASLKFPQEALLLEKAEQVVAIYAGLEAWDNLKEAALNNTLGTLQHPTNIESFYFAFQHQL